MIACHTHTSLKKGEQGEMQSRDHVVLSPRYQAVSHYLGTVLDIVLPVSVPIVKSHGIPHQWG